MGGRRWRLTERESRRGMHVTEGGGKKGTRTIDTDRVTP